MATEKYGNLASTTVASGGYTSGSGVLNVASTAAPFPQFGNFHIFVASPTGTVKVILKVTAVNSSTQFAVTAEGTDANALQSDVVKISLTAAAMNAIRGDASRKISGALPTDGQLGDRLYPTDDCVSWLHDGTAFLPYGPLSKVTNPQDTTLVFRNQGSATRTDRAGSLYLLAPVLGGNSMKILEESSYPSTPFTRTLGFVPHLHAANFNSFGPVFVQTSSGKVVGWILTNAGTSGGSLQVNYMTNVTTFGSTPAGPVGLVPYGSVMWLRVTDNGTNIIFLWSSNGLDFHTMATLGRTAHLTTTGPDKIGFHADSNGSQPAAGTVIHWG